MSNFLAIDFETADYGRDSACSIGLVRVENNAIVHEEVHLIRPPRPNMYFTHIHGLTYDDVSGAPTFGELWPKIRPLFEGVEQIAAHNASFDSGVLAACCKTYGLEGTSKKFMCTVQLAKKTWGFSPANLANVCRMLKIQLKHHEALSDARACAQIVIKAREHEAKRAQEAALGSQASSTLVVPPGVAL